MFCKFCGIENANGTKFCKKCGKNIGIVEELNKYEETDGVFIKEEEDEAVDNGVENAGQVTEDTDLNGGGQGIQHTDLNAGGQGIQHTDLNGGGQVTEGVTRGNNGGTNPGDLVNGGINKVKKNKVVVGVIGALVLIGIIFIGFKIFGSTISKSTLEKDIVGKKISVGSMSFTIDKDSIKDIKVKSEKEMIDQGMKFCEVLGTLELKNNYLSIEVPFSATYIYNNNEAWGEKGWFSSSIDIDIYSKDAKVVVDAKATDVDFKKSVIGQNVNNIAITEDMTKDMKVSNIEEKDFGTKVTADVSLNYDGSLISKEVKCSVTLRLEEGVWKFVNLNNSNSTITVKKSVGDISLKDYINDLNQIGSEQCIRASYKYIGTVSTFDIDQITEVKNVKVSEDVDWNKRRYIIDADVKIKSGKAVAEGALKVTIVEDGVSGRFSLNTDKFTVENPTKEDIASILKDSIIEHTSGDNSLRYKLRAEDANTFKVSEVVNVMPDPRYFAVYGTMSYNGVSDDSIVVFVSYDSTKGSFIVKEVGSFTIDYYKNSKSIEKIKESNAIYIERESKEE